MRSQEVFKTLCRASLEGSVVRLRDVGSWPLPPAMRRGIDRVSYNDFKNIKELDAFLEHLASDGTITSMYCHTSPGSWWSYFRLWERLLVNVLHETEGMDIEDTVFEKWFGRFVGELYTEEAVWRTIDTVTGLEFQGKKLEFDEATSLTATPGWDLDSLVSGQRLDFLDGSPGGMDKTTIVTTLKIPKKSYAGSASPYPHLLKEIERPLAVIESIRLLRPGASRLHCHVRVHLSDFPLEAPSAYCRQDGEPLPLEKAASLEFTDLPNVVELWNELMKTRYAEPWPVRTKVDPMGVAMGRFSRSYEQQTWLDDIVDLTIALESLFRPAQDSHQEISYRIATYASWLLGVDDADSTEVFDRIRTMYEIRSSTVHGGTPHERRVDRWLQKLAGIPYDPGTQSRYELVELATESARDIVRRAISACTKLSKLGPGSLRWPFPKDFDTRVVRLSEREAWQKAAGVRPK